METFRRFLMLSEPCCFGLRTYSTHDPSKLGVSQIEGMMSSGPDMVHDDDDEDVSDCDAGSAVFVVALLLSCRAFGVLVGSLFPSEKQLMLSPRIRQEPGNLGYAVR
jgi:hypothetical protein